MYALEKTPKSQTMSKEREELFNGSKCLCFLWLEISSASLFPNLKVWSQKGTIIMIPRNVAFASMEMSKERKLLDFAYRRARKVHPFTFSGLSKSQQSANEQLLIWTMETCM